MSIELIKLSGQRKRQGLTETELITDMVWPIIHYIEILKSRQSSQKLLRAQYDNSFFNIEIVEIFSFKNQEGRLIEKVNNVCLGG